MKSDPSSNIKRPVQNVTGKITEEPAGGYVASQQVMKPNRRLTVSPQKDAKAPRMVHRGSTNTSFFVTNTRDLVGLGTSKPFKISMPNMGWYPSSKLQTSYMQKNKIMPHTMENVTFEAHLKVPKLDLHPTDTSVKGRDGKKQLKSFYSQEYGSRPAWDQSGKTLNKYDFNFHLEDAEFRDIENPVFYMQSFNLPIPQNTTSSHSPVGGFRPQFSKNVRAGNNIGNLLNKTY